MRKTTGNSDSLDGSQHLAAGAKLLDIRNPRRLASSNNADQALPNRATPAGLPGWGPVSGYYCPATRRAKSENRRFITGGVTRA
jgi:hypothetical protein